MATFFDHLRDISSTIRWRRKLMPWAKGLVAKAPRAGDMAPDFALSDPSGETTVTLSDFRDTRPVVLFFGSYT